MIDATRPAAIEPYDARATTRATLSVRSARPCKSCPTLSRS